MIITLLGLVFAILTIATGIYVVAHAIAPEESVRTFEGLPGFVRVPVEMYIQVMTVVLAVVIVVCTLGLLFDGE